MSGTDDAVWLLPGLDTARSLAVGGWIHLETVVLVEIGRVLLSESSISFSNT